MCTHLAIRIRQTSLHQTLAENRGVQMWRALDPAGGIQPQDPKGPTVGTRNPAPVGRWLIIPDRLFRSVAVCHDQSHDGSVHVCHINGLPFTINIPHSCYHIYHTYGSVVGMATNCTTILGWLKSYTKKGCLPYRWKNWWKTDLPSHPQYVAFFRGFLCLSDGGFLK